jgi:endonuclease YncB( thermonuclease family)
MLQILRTLAIGAAAVFQLSNGHRTGPVLVASAASGHAIVVPGSGRVSLLGIRAPAVGRTALADPIAVAARDRLNGLVAHRFVILEYPQTIAAGTVPHGAAYVFLEDGTFVNRLMVREGLARVTGARSASRAKELADAEAAARSERRGLWAREPRRESVR